MGVLRRRRIRLWRRIPPDVPDRGLRMREKIIGFFDDVVKEMKKVTWPTKDELKDFTGVVLVATLIMAVFIYAVDTIVNVALRAIL